MRHNCGYLLSMVKQELKPCFLVLAALVFFGVRGQLAVKVLRGRPCFHLRQSASSRPWPIYPRPELSFLILQALKIYSFIDKAVSLNLLVTSSIWGLFFDVTIL